MFSAWGVLRFDDHRGLKPDSMVRAEGGWTFALHRSKTTGSDKAVLIRLGVVSEKAYLAEATWFRLGLELWTASAPFMRDYFLCQPGEGNGCRARELSYSEYSGRVRGLLVGVINKEGCSDMHSCREASMYFTPHSPRAFLPSAAGAIGADSECFGWLAAWKTKGATTYARSSRAKTL